MKIVVPVPITDARLSSSSLVEDEYPLWDIAQAYVIGDRVIYVAVDIHNIYEAVATSTAVDPYSDTGTYWVKVGSTNKYKMFDASVASQSVDSGTINVTVRLNEPIDTIAFIGTDATSVTVTITDPVAGVVYNAATSLVDPAGIDDWYEYFYEAPQRKVDSMLTNLPRYGGAAIRVVLSSPSGLVGCAEMVFGRAKEIGWTQYGAKVGIVDYSVKAINVFGEYALVKRAFHKTADFTVFIEPTAVDGLQALLASYRSDPVVYVGDDSFGSTIIYGFYRDFNVDIAYPSYSVCSITIEGL